MTGPSLTLADVLHHVAWEYGIGTDEINNRRSRFVAAQARLAFVWLARRHTRATYAEIASRLGCHKVSISWWLAGARRWMDGDSWVRARFLMLDEVLVSLAHSQDAELAA